MPDLTPEQIRTARQTLGETPEVFGRRFGVARTTILHWEKDGPPKTGPGRLHIERVLEELSQNQ